MSTKTVAMTEVERDDDYASLEQMVAGRIAAFAGPLFTTDADPDDLWNRYLAGIPDHRRQHYTCHCCRRFVQRFGGLVAINEHGHQSSLLWDIDPPPFFAESVGAMNSLVRRSRVTGVFVWDDKTDATWGHPTAGGWSHLAGRPTVKPRTKPTKEANEVAAELKEDYAVLRRGMAEFGVAVAEQAVRVLTQGDLYRSEKAEAVARWFHQLHVASGLHSNPRLADNVVWRAVATAPPGFAHVKNTVLGTLLEDIVNGLSFESISRRWKDKLHPLQYQRPTAPPTAGNIAQAEKLFSELGLAPALRRRFATLDDVQAFEWRPKPAEEKKPAGGGVFSHLLPREASGVVKPVELPAQTVTWEKFRKQVLPAAVKVEAMVTSPGNYYGLTAASDPAAPPILQWDGLADRPRNAVAWYVWHGGSPAGQWKLSPGYAEVAAVFPLPCHWQDADRFAHFGRGVCFALAGATETRQAGAALFPECLKAELREVRSTVEAYSRNAEIEGMEQGNANGLLLRDGSAVRLRVTDATGGLAHYILDRLD